MEKENWITWQDLVTRWKIDDIDLLEHLKQGLQPYSRNRLLIVCPYEHHAIHLLESELREINDKLLDNPINSLALESQKEVLNNKLAEVTKHDDINTRSWKNFIVPPNDLKIDALVFELRENRGTKFKEEDVSKYETEHGIRSSKARVDSATLSLGKGTEDHEAFIRNLRICNENDSEIIIQVKGRKADTYNCKVLGFRDETTKEWNMLCDILRDSDHTYHIGPAHTNLHGTKARNLSYDRFQQMFKQISKKLVSFLNKHYEVNIPQDYNLFEPFPGRRPGTYRPRFRVSEIEISETRTDVEKKAKVIRDIKDLSQKYLNACSNGDKKMANDTLENLMGLTAAARKHELVTESELKKIFEPIDISLSEYYQP